MILLGIIRFGAVVVVAVERYTFCRDAMHCDTTKSISFNSEPRTQNPELRTPNSKHFFVILESKSLTMKNLYALTLLFATFIFNCSAQYFSQYFDGEDTVFEYSVNVELDTSASNIWQVGKPQKIIFDSASTFPNALVTDTINFYPKNNISRFRIKILNEYTNYGIFALQWNQKLDLDSNFDGALLEFSIDNGETWQNAFNNPYVYNFYGYEDDNEDTLTTGEFVFSGTDSVWKNIWLCFDMSWMEMLPDTFNFRYSLLSDSIDNNKEGWMIDNILANITYYHTVKDVVQNSYLNVYPNPTTNIIYIEAQKLMEFHIIKNMELINAQGKTVEIWNNLPTKFWFDTELYPAGFYFLKVETNIKTETIPIVINKRQ